MDNKSKMDTLVFFLRSQTSSNLWREANDPRSRFSILNAADLELQILICRKNSFRANPSPLHFVVYFDLRRTTQFFLERAEYDINALDGDDRSALCVAVEENHLEIVQLLLDRGASTKTVDNYGLYPVHVAARLGHLEAVALLISRDGSSAEVKDDYGGRGNV